MRTVIAKAFVLGALAVGLLAYALAAVVAVTTQAAGRTIDARLGPLALVVVERVGATTSTTFGTGLIAVALLGGLANATVAAWLWRRRR